MLQDFDYKSPHSILVYVYLRFNLDMLVLTSARYYISQIFFLWPEYGYVAKEWIDCETK